MGLGAELNGGWVFLDWGWLGRAFLGSESYWCCERTVDMFWGLSRWISNLSGSGGRRSEDERSSNALPSENTNKPQKYEKWSVGNMSTMSAVSPKNPNPKRPAHPPTSLISSASDHQWHPTHFLLLPIIIILKAWPYFCNSKTTFNVPSVNCCVAPAKMPPNPMSTSPSSYEYWRWSMLRPN